VARPSAGIRVALRPAIRLPWVAAVVRQPAAVSAVRQPAVAVAVAVAWQPVAAA
jgi:hypothetical protein